MQNNMYYIDVILPLPVKGVFTYCSNDKLIIGLGGAGNNIISYLL